MAANTLNALIPTLYEARDVVSREQIGMIPAVTQNNSAERAALGQQILVPVVPALTMVDNVPSNVSPNPPGVVIGNTPMTISKSKSVQIPWTGEEQRGLLSAGEYHGILVNQIAQGFRVLSNAMELDLAAAAYQSASRAYGTAGTAPFGVPGDLSDIAQVRKILDDNGAPQGDLQLVLGGAAMANIRGKQNILFKVNESGTEDLLRQGIIGRLEGMSLRNSQAVVAVAKGTGAGYTTSTAGFPVGSTQIALITGSGTVLAGDTVTFAGDPNRYVVNVGVNGPGIITIGAPGLQFAITNSAVAVTIGNTSTPNLAFSRSAVQLITRPPAMPIGPDGKSGDSADDSIMVIDPKSGMTFEVALYRQFLQMALHIRIAWGTAGIKPAHTAILLG